MHGYMIIVIIGVFGVNLLNDTRPDIILNDLKEQ